MAYAFNDDKSKKEFVKNWVDIPIKTSSYIMSGGILRYYKDVYGTVTIALNIDFNSPTLAGRSIILADTPEEIKPQGQSGLAYGRNLGVFATSKDKRASIEVNNSQITINAFDTLEQGDWIVCEASYNPTY